MRRGDHASLLASFDSVLACGERARNRVIESRARTRGKSRARFGFAENSKQQERTDIVPFEDDVPIPFGHGLLRNGCLRLVGLRQLSASLTIQVMLCGKGHQEAVQRDSLY